MKTLTGSLLDCKTIEDWSNSGLLHGLPKDKKQEMVHYFNKVVEYHEKFKNIIKSDRTITVILPVVRRIYGLIIEKKFRFLETPSNAEKVLKFVDVEEIYNELDSFSYSFSPIAETFLESIDSEANMTVLFCENYIFRIMEKVKNSERSIPEMSLDEIRKEKIKSVRRGDYEMASRLRNEENLRNSKSDIEQTQFQKNISVIKKETREKLDRNSNKNKQS